MKKFSLLLIAVLNFGISYCQDYKYNIELWTSDNRIEFWLNDVKVFTHSGEIHGNWSKSITNLLNYSNGFVNKLQVIGYNGSSNKPRGQNPWEFGYGVNKISQDNSNQNMFIEIETKPGYGTCDGAEAALTIQKEKVCPEEEVYNVTYDIIFDSQENASYTVHSNSIGTKPIVSNSCPSGQKKCGDSCYDPKTQVCCYCQSTQEHTVYNRQNDNDGEWYECDTWHRAGCPKQ